MKLFWLVLVLQLFVGLKLQAQNQMAKAVGEYPYVYSAPDFNAPVIAELEQGKSYPVSTKKFSELFYKIQVKPGMLGYVSDSEVQVGGLKTAPNKKLNPKQAANPNKKTKPKEEKPKSRVESSRKPFYATRYRGVVVEQMNYAEDTMSKHRTANLTFFGYRVTGFNTMFTGEMSTDASVLVYFGAPKYYEEITGQPASGWILHSSFTFDTLYPQSKYHLVSYGFGPMFKYSHLVTSMKNTTNSFNTDYPMDDMTLGVLLRLGLAFRINSLSIRSDVKYYIESQRYLAYNIAALFEF